MSEEITKVPAIRFKGFTDPWEQRKLKDMADFSKGNGYSKADLTEEGHPVILYGRMYTKYETVIASVDTFAKLKEKSVISKGAEVIVPASGESAEDISRASVVDIAGVALGGDLNIIMTNNELNPTFLALTISNGSQQKEMSKRAQGKSVVHLHNSDLKEVNLLLPRVEEQKEIGSFFKQLDTTITLQQRELDLMKKQKQTLLSKMFPKIGEQSPEIRFKGFTDPWEQCKLGDVLTERSMLQPQSEEYPLVSFTVEKGVTQKTDRYDREQLVSGDIAAKKYKITEYDDIVYNPANLKFGAIARNKYGNAVFSPIYVTFKVDDFLAFPEFVERLVSRSDFIQYSLKYQQGTVYERQSVNQEDLLSLSIPLPNIKEQKIIGILFDNIDNTITLQQRKLDQMKIMKKSLLKAMFV